MVTEPPTTLTPGSGPNKRDERDATGRAPRRDEIERGPRTPLKVSGRTKADVYRIDIDGSPAVVKDFRAKPWWVRALGRFLIGREVRAYRALDGAVDVPRCRGRIDPWALAVDFVDGDLLAFAPDRFREGPRHVHRLRAAIDRLHRRGVAHLDLRGRDNVLLARDGRIVLLDLAGAVRLRPGGIAHRLLFRALAVPDESAFLKWKRLLDPDGLTDDERARLDRFGRVVRPWWPFNRKSRDTEGPSV